MAEQLSRKWGQPVLDARGHVKAGKLRALAATSDKRVSALHTKIIRERGITTQ